MPQVMNMNIIYSRLFTGGCKRGFHILYPATHIDMGRWCAMEKDPRRLWAKLGPYTHPSNKNGSAY